ncbi:MAG: nicotinamide mononucleotide transporter family protein [Paludibacter sp.]|jgi:nicotinamide mononucleotide transporter|nr:nicotinamide mononucleotide transporter family protein [Paludibacter sp.]
MFKKLVRSVVFSRYIDVFGAVLVLVTCLLRNFHLTFYDDGQIISVPLGEQWSTMLAGAFPLGWLSTIGAIFSLLSTRLVGKQNNTGNWIGLATTINSGAVDYFLGNHSAIITYPLTFFIHTFAVVKWTKGVKIRKIDFWYYIINIIGIIIAYLLVWFGMKIFGGRTDFWFFHIIAITFGLSLGANFCTAFKYETTYLGWTVYNIIQLIKATLQLNVANIAKYAFYIFNAVVTLGDWIWNRDVFKKLIVESGERRVINN